MMVKGTLYRIGNDYMVAKTLVTEALDEAKASFKAIQLIRESGDPYTFPEELPMPVEVMKWFKEWFGDE